MDPKSPEFKKALTDYLSTRRVLVADTVSSSRNGIVRLFVNLGVKSTSVVACNDYATAKEEIEKRMPDIVVTDFMLGDQSALKLLDVMKKDGDRPKDALFIVVTGNASQTSVVEAAEEEVDSYILKPYSVDDFTRIFGRSVLARLRPSPYKVALAEAQEFLRAGKRDEALSKLNAAVALHPRPTLAFCYLAQVDEEMGNLAAAEESYLNGLEHDPNHFKCLSGLSDLYLKMKKFHESYETGRKLASVYPLSAKRLVQLVRLVVVTERFQDAEELYEFFKAMDERSEELVRYICAMLVVSGKNAFQQGARERALDLLSKASLTAAGKTSILKEVVATLADQGALVEASSALKRFSVPTTDPDLRIAKLVLEDREKGDAMQTVNQAQALLREGIKDAWVYEVLIRRLVELGRKDQAAEFAQTATQALPAEKDRFTKLVQS